MKPDELKALRAVANRLADQPHPDAGEVLERVDQLIQAGAFGPARRLLERARPKLEGDPNHGLLIQKQALCTYQDVDLPADRRYPEALGLLKTIGLGQADCRDAETLRQGGAIYRRMWETEGQMGHLYAALAFYRAGWDRDPERDLGRCGVNAAYLLDVLSFQQGIQGRRAGADETPTTDAADQARRLREDMARRLPGLLERSGQADTYWARARLAEVLFGLEDYSGAGDWLAKARATGPDEDRPRATAERLVSLARLRGAPPPEPGKERHKAWNALERLLGNDTSAALGGWRGKVGLALSGGGFRAALFHLGVLARLAECDILRSLETLSTVSGGSIVGAQYYLELRRLLQTKPDAEITRDDYLELVQRLIQHMMATVQKNPRVRALANLETNLRMIFSRAYSRSTRMGELYERHLFSQSSGYYDEPRPLRLRDLKVFPATELAANAPATDFKPRAHNWRRRAKVPNLMLNATSLNSGHNWHFTASWMGEPPGLAGDEIDVNDRYRRLYYDQAPNPALRDYPLSHAVAASSCVPGMFEPLPLNDLYPGRTVRLVDGGVHDNQGMAGLLDDGCELILCSDAAGQMESQAKPSNGLLGVLMRTSGILQARVRATQYRDIQARVRGGALRGLFFIHLRQELEPDPIDWIACEDPQPKPNRPTSTDYGMDRELQRLLSEIRTDLDSFTEVEAYALMASGYRMTDHQLRDLNRRYQDKSLPGTWGDFEVQAPMWRKEDGGEDWPFAPLLPLLTLPANSDDKRRRELGRQLKAGGIMFLRAWVLVPWLRNTALVGGLAALMGATLWVRDHWEEILTFNIQFSLEVGAFILALVLALLAIGNPLFKFLNPRKASQSGVAGVIVALFGWIASNLHLGLFDPLVRRHGTLERLLKMK